MADKETNQADAWGKKVELKRSYRFLRAVLHLFTPRINTVWDEPWDGEPCVFCPNHDRAWGPINMCVWFDGRNHIHPWYNAGVVDRKGLPAYVRNDNWWNPNSKLAWLWNATIPHIAAWLMPPIIGCTPGIPVYYDAKVATTFRQSTDLLKKGGSMVIFAQYPDGYESHAEHLSKGFLLIAPLAWKRCGIRLKFYPVHCDQKSRTIHVMKPIQFDPERTLPEQEAELLAYLEERVHD